MEAIPDKSCALVVTGQSATASNVK